MTGGAKAAAEVFVVDDDPAVRDALSVVLSLDGFHVSSFAEGDSFVAAARDRVPACVILDVHMPGRSGLEILREFHARHYPAPILMISGRGDIPMAVDAIKNGAVDFIEKPFDAGAVIARVREAVTSRAASAAAPPPPADFPGHERLTRREHEVLALIAAGASNKEAGRRLGISPRTVEVHRARIMEKLGARNAADLVRIVLSERPRS